MGNETGEGAEQQPGGEQPGGEPTEQSPREGGQPGSQQPGGEGEPGERANPSDNRDANDAASGGAMPMGGEGGPGSGEDIPPGGELLAGDKANLDYAREQTDLVIESLDDQLTRNRSTSSCSTSWAGPRMSCGSLSIVGKRAKRPPSRETAPRRSNSTRPSRRSTSSRARSVARRNEHVTATAT